MSQDPAAPSPAAPARAVPSIAEPSPSVAYLEFKAAILLVLMLLLVASSAVYLLYARGAFEATQQLVLLAEDSEGVTVGMDLTFSGFPIGRVRRVELGGEGEVRILIDIARKDAHWLRESSVFTMVRGVVGNTNLRAYSGVLTDPPLADGAERKVLLGDASEDLPRMVSAARDLAQNLAALTASDSALANSLRNVETVTEKLKGRGGALGVLMGSDADARKLGALVDRSNALLARLDGVAAKADSQIFGDGGMMPEMRASIAEMRALLQGAQATLKKVDGVLDEAHTIAVNARVATTDLDLLRAEVDATLQKVEHLVGEINRKWPFASDSELKLP
jgi:phospholipid/cholesterol/gamma-HCH transport system substrate-binding protein